VDPNTNPFLLVPGTKTVQGLTTLDVAGTAKILIPATNEPSLSILVIPRSSNTATVYLGGSAVTSTGGTDAIPIYAPYSVDLDHRRSPLYINCASAGGNGVFWQILVA